MIAISDEDLMRFADGELSPAAAGAIHERLPHDAELRRRLDVFLVTRAPVAAVFNEVLAEPVPERLIAAVMRTAPAVRSAPSPIGWTERLRAMLEDAVAALAPAHLSPAFAAGLTAAVLTSGTVGWLAGRASAPAPMITASAAGLVASGALAHALEATPSETPYAGDRATIVPVMSFATETDGVCREYRIMRTDAGPDYAGLACRTPEGAWSVALHVGTPKNPPANPEKPHQTAGSHAVAEIDALVATLISGNAFGNEDEAERINNAWRGPVRKPE
jgi:anti-sigma factor RsiW